MREKIPKSASKQQFKDNETAEDIRKKAMERHKETKKRHSDEGAASPKHHRTTGRLFARESSGGAKLHNRSYVQNNRNRKVNSK